MEDCLDDDAMEDNSNKVMELKAKPSVGMVMGEINLNQDGG